MFWQKQQGWQVAQPSARSQNGALRKLAQKLLEQDSQPTIIDGLNGIREINNISPCLRPCLRPKRPSLRRNRPPLTVMFLCSVGAPFLRPGLRFHRAPFAAAVRKRAAAQTARSRLLWRAWRARQYWTLTAAAHGATLIRWCVRNSASASHNPYSSWEAEAGSPSNTVLAASSKSAVCSAAHIYRCGRCACFDGSALRATSRL